MNRQPGDRRPRSGKVQQLRLESGGLIASLAVLLVLTALIVTCASCRLYDAGHSDRTSDLPSGEAPAASEQTDLSSGGDEKPEANIEYLSLSEKDLRTGDLILVNRVHLYDAANAAGDATTVRDGRLTDIQENAFQLPIGEQILAALEEMQKGMVAAMNDGVRLLVNAGYRTAEVQQGLIDSFTESKGEEYVRQYVAPVGASEHHTPYAADISFYDTTGKKVLATTSVDAAAYYSWCLLNCKNYGLILRYTADKTDITGYSAESWHFRYVGVPHASYIYAHGLALEEYIEQLKVTSYSNRLYITADDGRCWSVYYIAAEDGAAGTAHVPVPKQQKYTVSGNNADGYIVTAEEPSGAPEGAMTELVTDTASSGAVSGEASGEA